jgi:LuxR family transcriptional regulator, maltose regulon positive regulatory protein
MNTTTLLGHQLLSTKFYAPTTPGTLIARPRLGALLDESLHYPCTLISAPAGFGKTTLLSTWVQSQQVGQLSVAWVSLDEEDNEPRLFWLYILSALHKQQPERFAPLLAQLQSSQAPPMKYLVNMLINVLTESAGPLLLILDDYQAITESQVHSTLSYLVEHLPAHLHLILSTRANPPLPLPYLRVRRHLLEIRTEQLRCTTEETHAFFQEVMAVQLPDNIIEEVTMRTEGWLVGLHLLGLSLPTCPNPTAFLQDVSGDQRYVLDYLTDVVLRQQPPDIQTFLLFTCILERLTASLCDAVTEQTGSQQMLSRLEQANLFVVSLDTKREWYRYHALFAQALRSQLEHTHRDLTVTLHARASRWYAQHDQMTQAILHAFSAREWLWVADLIEQKLLPLTSFAWGASKHVLIPIKEWLQQLPTDVMHARPSLCLASAMLLFQITPYSLLEGWLGVAEATLTTVLSSTQTGENSSSDMSPQQNLLGAVVALRASLKAFEGDGQGTLDLHQQALSLLSPENIMPHVHILLAQTLAYYTSALNNAMTAVEVGSQAIALAQAAGQSGLIILAMNTTVVDMIGTGQLHRAHRLILQAIELSKQSNEIMFPETGWSIALQARILCEWNQLDAAFTLAQEAVSLSQQAESVASLAYVVLGYTTLLHIALSRRDLEMARRAFHESQHIGTQLNQLLYLHQHSYFLIIDQVRLWLACGELKRATRWAEELEVRERHGTPFVRERQEVACARVLLAQAKPDVALQRLSPVLQRATAGSRWGHVIEIWILQALAYQMCQQERQALDALSEAVRLGEPEGYLRSFVDEGLPMEVLFYQLRKREGQHGPTPYLDRVLAAFQKESHLHQPIKGSNTDQALPNPLSPRELEVLQLMALGASNQEIADKLVIALDTVKRHVSHILFKLGVQNRLHAVMQAEDLQLLKEEL